MKGEVTSKYRKSRAEETVWETGQCKSRFLKPPAVSCGTLTQIHSLCSQISVLVYAPVYLKCKISFYKEECGIKSPSSVLAFQLVAHAGGDKLWGWAARAEPAVCVHVSACASLPTYCTEKLMYIKRFAHEENLFLKVAGKELNLVMTKIDEVPF